MTEKERPLVTFALFAFNQEAFVREAVQAALAQTYSPLQIILSDDYSADRTFEIMREEAQRYSGQHEVELNSNPTNLGLAGHFKVVMEKCRGEFIVVAAGDDISFPQRTAELVDVWDREGRKVMSIFSGYKLIDTAGRITGVKAFFEGYHWATPTLRINGNIPIEGVTHAFSKRVYDDFGPFVEDAINEDVLLQFRASLRAGVFVISDQLASYRKHFENLSNLDARLSSSSEGSIVCQIELVHLDRYLRCLRNFSRDIGTAIQRGWVSGDHGKKLLELANKQIKTTTARHAFLSQKRSGFLAALIFLARSGISLQTIARDILLRHFPDLFLQGRNVKGRLRKLIRSI